MMYLTRVYHFSSAHRLQSGRMSNEENRRLYGKCAGPSYHGHNYRLEVTVAGVVDATTGCVMSLAKLDEIVEKNVIEVLDHKNLNEDVEYFRNHVPTMENIARWIWAVIDPILIPIRLSRIRLYETDRSYVEYTGG